jgi:hypothetical protein
MGFIFSLLWSHIYFGVAAQACFSTLFNAGGSSANLNCISASRQMQRNKRPQEPVCRRHGA